LELSKKEDLYEYPSMVKELGTFKLTVEQGGFSNCEILVLLGENGCGKTTLIKMLTGQKGYAPDTAEFDVID
jgi:ATP-binding cassette subfamily E protein 1